MAMRLLLRERPWSASAWEESPRGTTVPIQKTTDHAHDYNSPGWTDRVDNFEVAELFEFL
jgi:hypothetical protein